MPERAAYDNDVSFTGETSFTENGILMFGSEADRLQITTVGEGTLAPCAQAGLHEGSVIWRVVEEDGEFAGATGLITSNFTANLETGEGNEHLVLSLFLP